jgi:hypothetical protein
MRKAMTAAGTGPRDAPFCIACLGVRLSRRRAGEVLRQRPVRAGLFPQPVHRDARQIHSGPGYYESCSRYDGCRGVRAIPYGYGPYVPVVVPVPASDD